MNKFYLTTKEISDLVGCSLRQLQYWRKRKIIIPAINSEGKGKTIYYSVKQIYEIKLFYFLSSFLDFKIAIEVFEKLKEMEKISVMIILKEKQFKIIYYDSDLAKRKIRDGFTIIPIFLDEL
jgi:hypothetical protein